MNECSTCGYKGEKIHDDLYDCMDFLDPLWMGKWFNNIQKEKSKEPYVSNFVKWTKSVREENK